MFIQNSGTDATNLCVCLYYSVTTVEKYGLAMTMAEKQHRRSDHQITLLQWFVSFISNCSKGGGGEGGARGAKYWNCLPSNSSAMGLKSR